MNEIFTNVIEILDPFKKDLLQLSQKQEIIRCARNATYKRREKDKLKKWQGADDFGKLASLVS